MASTREEVVLVPWANLLPTAKGHSTNLGGKWMKCE